MNIEIKYNLYLAVSAILFVVPFFLEVKAVRQRMENTYKDLTEKIPILNSINPIIWLSMIRGRMMLVGLMGLIIFLFF